jgi:hypothetical protein
MKTGLYFNFADLLLQVSITLISVVLISELCARYESGAANAILGIVLSLNGFSVFLKIPFIG